MMKGETSLLREKTLPALLITLLRSHFMSYLLIITRQRRSRVKMTEFPKYQFFQAHLEIQFSKQTSQPIKQHSVCILSR